MLATFSMIDGAGSMPDDDEFDETGMSKSAATSETLGF